MDNAVPEDYETSTPGLQGQFLLPSEFPQAGMTFSDLRLSIATQGSYGLPGVLRSVSSRKFTEGVLVQSRYTNGQAYLLSFANPIPALPDLLHTLLLAAIPFSPHSFNSDE